MVLSPGSVVNRFCIRSASSDDNSDFQAKPSMGQLALYLLALRANCEFVGGHKGDRLVSQLKRFLEDEKMAIGEGTQSAWGGVGSSELWACSQASFLPSNLPISLSN